MNFENVTIFLSMIGSIFGGLIVMGGFMITMGRKFQILDALVASVEEIKRDIREMRRDIASIFKDLVGIHKDIAIIHNDISQIKQTISTHDTDIQNLKLNVFGLSNSPMQPNEIGKKVLIEAKWDETYPLIKSDLYIFIEKIAPPTLYDLERAAYLALNSLKNEPAFYPAKNYVVNHPDITLDMFLGIAAWVVREDYAREKGIK